VLSACQSGEGSIEPIPPDNLPAWNGEHDFFYTIFIDGRERKALVHLPAEYEHDPAWRLPLLFAFHGSGGSGSGMRDQTGMDALADEGGFVVAYLYSAGNWVTPCEGCDPFDREPDEDIRFTRQLARALAWEYAVDPYELFAAGFSAGGMFLHYLACVPDSPVQGVAMVAALAPRDLPEICPRAGAPREPRPVATINGLKDSAVPPGGSESRLSVDEAGEFWRDWNRCRATVVEEAEPEVVGDGEPRMLRSTWSDCSGGARVSVRVVEEAGHTWLKADDNPSGIDYGRTIVRFFGLGG
jgi:polyhydroxybutyrate depolymerase